MVKGIKDGCDLSDCLLAGGETAEMPGFYADGEYDLAGFCVGSVPKDRVIDGSTVKKGDVVLGLPSSGVHSNGFSLVRRVIDASGLSLLDPAPWTDGVAPGASLGQALLTPTRIYVRDVLRLHDALRDTPDGGLKAACHVTGEGHPGNIPRVLPKGLTAKLDTTSWTPPGVFQWIRSVGNCTGVEMYTTFNMGIGMILVCSKDAVAVAQRACPDAIVVGEIVEGTEVILDKLDW